MPFWASMFYWEKKIMKFLLLFLVGCASMSQGKYKKEFHLEDFKSSSSPQTVFSLLSEKMTKCYPQSEYPVFEKTIASFDPEKQVGTISYDVDNQSIGRKMLVLVEVFSDSSGTLIKVYAKGDLLRSADSFKHQIHKWIDGKKVDCDSRGQI
jgi:hypothetical protein